MGMNIPLSKQTQQARNLHQDNQPDVRQAQSKTSFWHNGEGLSIPITSDGRDTSMSAGSLSEMTPEKIIELIEKRDPSIVRNAKDREQLLHNINMGGFRNEYRIGNEKFGSLTIPSSSNTTFVQSQVGNITFQDGTTAETLFENGRNPGHNIRAMLQKTGCKGQGVRVAIIDSGINTEHEALSYHFDQNHKGQHTAINENGEITDTLDADMHGTATADILAGKDGGVAPDCELHAYSCPYNQTHTALNNIIEFNEDNADNPIRVVNISAGFYEPQKGSEGYEVKMKTYESTMEAIKKLQESGVMVIANYRGSAEHTPYSVASRIAPSVNPDDDFAALGNEPENYESRIDGCSGDEKNRARTLLINSSHRTVATEDSINEYRHDGAESSSWAMPVISGLYACACSADPTITPEKFWDIAVETGKIDECGGTIVDAEALIDKIIARKK